MLKKLFPDVAGLASDVKAFQRQESIFIGLNLVLLAVLLFLHWRFASFWGNPSQPLVIAIISVFLLKSLELIWVQRLRNPLQPMMVVALTWTSIVVNLALAILLDDGQVAQLNPLESREARGAIRTKAAAADRPAIIGRPGVLDLCVVGSAKRAAHLPSPYVGG